MRAVSASPVSFPGCALTTPWTDQINSPYSMLRLATADKGQDGTWSPEQSPKLQKVPCGQTRECAPVATAAFKLLHKQSRLLRIPAVQMSTNTAPLGKTLRDSCLRIRWSSKVYLLCCLPYHSVGSIMCSNTCSVASLWALCYLRSSCHLAFI